MEGSVIVSARPTTHQAPPLIPKEASSLEMVVRGEATRFSTPCYVFDPRIVIERYNMLRSTVRTSLIVSLKANPTADLFSRCFHAFVDGVEVASEAELSIVVGRSKMRKFVNNPSMDAAFMRSAVAAHATVIVDNLRHVELLVAQTVRLKPTPVVLRLNAGIIREKRSPPPSDHFGMDLSDALTAVERLGAAGIGIAGCHSFAGSYSFGQQSAINARNMAEVVAVIEGRLGYRLTMINLGGGFAPTWEDKKEEVVKYAAALDPLHATYTLFHESGRGIFARAGAFATRVVATKILDGQHIVICDGGMAQNFLLSQTENTLRNLASPVMIASDMDERKISTSPIRFVGLTCNKNDVIGHSPAGSILPRPGDICFFENCGAYNATYTVAKFLGSR